MAVDTSLIEIVDEPLILVAAILVALLVVAVVLIPCFRCFRGRRLSVFSGVGASVFAIAAVILGDLSFTRWALYDGGHGRPFCMAPWSDWLIFVTINAILAAASGIPGGLLGLLIGSAIERKMPPKPTPATKSTT